ncbi:hypothetical protein COLO4_04785 [Corchorus olitorius]|uniref:Uncharacterized protein n=1 Tax=Corchorus olitorius TaxID=93759 RepID=A0A1R3KST8_9ROSI|nr:hypothetical protein COLO4_04785 [Corchorus olitorius]
MSITQTKNAPQNELNAQVKITHHKGVDRVMENDVRANEECRSRKRKMLLRRE